MINAVREQHAHVILVDGGDTFDASQKLPAERAWAVWRGMSAMGYDVVNVADGELSLGWPLFEKLVNETKIPVISASFNASIPKDQSGWIKPYRIVNVGSFRVGIIGITSSDFFDQSPAAETAREYMQAEQGLDRFLRDVRQQSDVVVLLAHLGYERAKSLIQNRVPPIGVDVVICGHGRGLSQQPEMINGIVLVQNSMGGEYLGKLMLTIDKENNKKIGVVGESIALTEDIAEDPTGLAVMQAFHDEERKVRRLKEKEQQMPSIKAMQEQLKKSPQELLDSLKQRGRTFGTGSSGQPPLIPPAAPKP